jgi:hypothetical protein
MKMYGLHCFAWLTTMLGAVEWYMMQGLPWRSVEFRDIPCAGLITQSGHWKVGSSSDHGSLQSHSWRRLCGKGEVSGGLRAAPLDTSRTPQRAHWKESERDSKYARIGQQKSCCCRRPGYAPRSMLAFYSKQTLECCTTLAHVVINAIINRNAHATYA